MFRDENKTWKSIKVIKFLRGKEENNKERKKIFGYATVIKCTVKFGKNFTIPNLLANNLYYLVSFKKKLTLISSCWDFPVCIVP